MLKASRLLSGRGAGTRTQAWLTGALLLTILLTMTPAASWSCSRVEVSTERLSTGCNPSEKPLSSL